MHGKNVDWRMMTNIVLYRFDGIINFQCTYNFTLIRFLAFTHFSLTLSHSPSFSLTFRFISISFYVLLVRIYFEFMWITNDLSLAVAKKAKNLNDIDYVICVCIVLIQGPLFSRYFFLTLPMWTKKMFCDK